ncbi:MAG: hypothetical protein Kow00108_24890 [Calditrichia bacterium]
MNKVCITLMLGIFLFLSCLNPFAPGLVDDIGNGSSILTAQKTPDEVLQNFQYAYTFRDSIVYADLLDTAFIYRTWDYEQSPPIPVEWNRDEELRITGRMFRSLENLDLVWNRTIYTDTLTMQLLEMRKSFTLTVNGGTTIPVINGEVIFRFINKNNTWYIIYWEDLKI